MIGRVGYEVRDFRGVLERLRLYLRLLREELGLGRLRRIERLTELVRLFGWRLLGAGDELEMLLLVLSVEEFRVLPGNGQQGLLIFTSLKLVMMEGINHIFALV